MGPLKNPAQACPKFCRNHQMFNVCPNCGCYRPAKIIDARGQSAICPACLHAFPYRHGPLFVLSGASGAGKSAVALELAGKLDEAVVFESDILWIEEFANPEQWPRFFDLSLRQCKNIAQSGKPVLLCGTGHGVPENLYSCPEARYFSVIHFLALVCDDAVLARRLRSRPAWRKSSDPASLDDQIRFNRWFRLQGSRPQSPITVFDTTHATLPDTAAYIHHWLATILGTHTDLSDVLDPSSRSTAQGEPA